MKRVLAALIALVCSCAPALAAPPTFNLDSPPPPGAAILYCVVTSGSPPYTAYPCDSTHPVPVTIVGGGGGGGGAVTAISGAFADGALVTEGTEGDAAWTSGSGTLVALDKAIDRDILLVNGKLPALGQTTKAASVSVAIASDQTVPVSGTFWQATQPVSGAASSFADGAIITVGTEADAACSSDNGACTAEALLKRANQRDTAIITALGTPFQAGGSIANLFALDATLGTTNTDIGPPGATTCATDTGSCSINALFQRNNQRLTSLLTALGTPMQATGGTVQLVAGSAVIGHVIMDSGSTTVVTGTVAATQSGTWNINSIAAAVSTVGNINSGSADGSAPIKTGGVYHATPLTFTDGNRTDTQTDIHGSAKSLAVDSTGAPIDYTQNINVGPGPGGRVDVSCSTGNVAAAVATCTMPATTGKTTYVTGFDITGSGATAAAAVTCTLTNTNSGTHSYTFVATAGVAAADNQLVKSFVGAPLKATASNTAPVLSCPSLGSGNTNMTINVDGYEL